MMDLSIHTRRMKFMQRGQSAETNQALLETTGQVITDEQWELDIPALTEKQAKYDIIDSHAEICDLRYGRMSFQGFNKVTEKMMRVWNNEEPEEEEPKKEDGEDESDKSVSDNEMADRYTTLVGTVAKKFRKKRQKNGKQNDSNIKEKRRKKDPTNFFLKPDEDS